jgi:hypothetical protein
MKPTAWHERGWPLCPVCGHDELAVLEIPPLRPTYQELAEWYLQREMFCYWCARVTVEAGEARIV